MKLYINLVTQENVDERPAEDLLAHRDVPEAEAVPEPVLRLVRRVTEGVGATVGRDVRFLILKTR